MDASLMPGFSAACETTRVGHFQSSLSFPLSAPLYDHLFTVFSLVLSSSSLSQTCGGLRLCPGPYLPSIFTHIHSRLHSSFFLQFGDTSVPPAWSSLPEPRTRHLTACLISVWMSNGHLQFDQPSSSFSLLSKGQASLSRVREC